MLMPSGGLTGTFDVLAGMKRDGYDSQFSSEGAVQDRWQEGVKFNGCRLQVM